ncbi:MAG: sigma-70 family RNA polymerase sigma factor [Caulobacteraceae bacterium]
MTGRILPFGPRLAAAEPVAPAARGPSRGEPEPAPLSADEQARFRRLVLPHMDGAYNFARYLCRDASLAEDLVQDAFLRAFRGFRGFRGGDPRAWLFAIVRSSHLTGVRSPGARLQPVPDDVEARPAEGDSPEDALVRQGEIDTVRTAIESLPEPFRETLVLRELEELSYREIAEVTAAPIGTVMSRLARARQMLLAALPTPLWPGEEASR